MMRFARKQFEEVEKSIWKIRGNLWQNCRSSKTSVIIAALVKSFGSRQTEKYKSSNGAKQG